MLCGLFLSYLAAGILTALAFALFGAPRVVPSSFTPGARILLIPGAFALWPYILFRWLKARTNQ
jgi:hypothetical protein